VELNGKDLVMFKAQMTVYKVDVDDDHTNGDDAGAIDVDDGHPNGDDAGAIDVDDDISLTSLS
jgi:hypothetical protein